MPNKPPAPGPAALHGEAAATAAAGLLLEGAFSGRLQFAQLVRDALAQAAQQGWREITLCDASFDDWPLGDIAVAQSLAEWSQSGRKCTILAKRYDALIAQHHRFVSWRGRWSHIIEARGVPSADADAFPSAIYSPGWVMQRLDKVRCNGIASHAPQRRLQLREELAGWLAKSSPAFSATVLGL